MVGIRLARDFRLRSGGFVVPRFQPHKADGCGGGVTTKRFVADFSPQAFPCRRGLYEWELTSATYSELIRSSGWRNK
jgi:hypothetical protein